MPPECSNRILDHYFLLTKSDVLITLSNMKMIRCELIGYFKNDDGTISEWHIAPITTTLNTAVDAFGYLTGTLIHHNQIDSIQFEADNTIISNHSST